MRQRFVVVPFEKAKKVEEAEISLSAMYC